MLSGEPRDEVDRQSGSIRERLVVVVDQRLDQRTGVVEADDLLAVDRAEALRDVAGGAKLVVATAHVEADGEGLHGRRDVAHQRDDGARVDAAAQECADGNVADHVRVHRTLQQIADPLHGRPAACVVSGVEHVPVTLAHQATVLHQRAVARR